MGILSSLFLTPSPQLHPAPRITSSPPVYPSERSNLPEHRGTPCARCSHTSLSRVGSHPKLPELPLSRKTNKCEETTHKTLVRQKYNEIAYGPKLLFTVLLLSVSHMSLNYTKRRMKGQLSGGQPETDGAAGSYDCCSLHRSGQLRG